MLLFLGAALLHLGNGLRFLRWFCAEKFPRTKYAASTQVAFAAGAIAGLTALLVHAVFDFHFHIPVVAMLAAFGLGVLANPGFEAASRRASWPAMLRGGMKAAMIVAGALMVFCGFNYGRGELYLDRGKRYPGAQLSFENVSFFGRAKELDPRNPFVYFASGDAWRRRVRDGMPDAVKRSFLEKAKEEYEAAYRLHPYDIYIILPLARCLDDLGLHDEADARFREALGLASLYYYPRLEYAIHLHRLKRFDEAAAAYAEALEGHALRQIDESMDRVRELQEELARDRKAAEEKAKDKEKAAAAFPGALPEKLLASPRSSL
jgi:tetratricopeptide (TPR) repeat protein